MVDRFAQAGVARGDIACEPKTFSFAYPGPPAAFLDEFIHFYGPTMNAVEAADQAGRGDALRQELRALFERQNTSGTNDASAISATFLQVTVRVG